MYKSSSLEFPCAKRRRVSAQIELFVVLCFRFPAGPERKREENQQSHRWQRLYAGTLRDQGTVLERNVGEESSRRGGPFYDPANNMYVTKKKKETLKSNI